MKESFDFVDAGRTFACRIEAARNPRVAAWWWFSVSNDRQRYAPFHSDASDSEDSVRSRIVAFYENRLARLAAPRQPWRRPEKPETNASTIPDPSGPASLPSDPPHSASASRGDGLPA